MEIPNTASHLNDIAPTNTFDSRAIYMRPDACRYIIPTDASSMLSVETLKLLDNVIEAGDSRTTKEIGELLGSSESVAKCAGLQLLEDSITWNDDEGFGDGLFSQLQELLTSEYDEVKLGVLRVLRFYDTACLAGTNVPHLVVEYVTYFQSADVCIAAVELCFYMAEAGESLPEADMCRDGLTKWISILERDDPTSWMDAIYENLAFFVEAVDSFQRPEIHLLSLRAIAAIIWQYLRLTSIVKDKYPEIFKAVIQIRKNEKLQMELDYLRRDYGPDISDLEELSASPTSASSFRFSQPSLLVSAREDVNQIWPADMKDRLKILSGDSSAVERWEIIKPIVVANLKGPKLYSQNDDFMDMSRFIRRENMPIEQGCFSDVYKAHFINFLVDNENTSETIVPLAVKVLRVGSQREETQEMVKETRKELSTLIEMTGLRHKNILSYIGFETIQSERVGFKFTLVTLWMSNGDLPSYISSNPNIDRLPFLGGIIDGLVFLHTRKPQIVHGCFNAFDVMIDKDCTPLLYDSRFRAITTPGVNSSGNPRYLAPEYLIEDNSNPSTAMDIYSYAMTTYHIMTGKVPFHEFHYNGGVTIAISKHKRPTRPFAYNGTCNRLWNLMVECWSTDPKKRPNAERVQSAIKNIRANLGTFGPIQLL